MSVNLNLKTTKDRNAIVQLIKSGLTALQQNDKNLTAISKILKKMHKSQDDSVKVFKESLEQDDFTKNLFNLYENTASLFSLKDTLEGLVAKINSSIGASRDYAIDQYMSTIDEKEIHKLVASRKQMKHGDIMKKDGNFYVAAEKNLTKYRARKDLTNQDFVKFHVDALNDRETINEKPYIKVTMDKIRNTFYELKEHDLPKLINSAKETLGQLLNLGAKPPKLA